MGVFPNLGGDILQKYPWIVCSWMVNNSLILKIRKLHSQQIHSLNLVVSIMENLLNYFYWNLLRHGLRCTLVIKIRSEHIKFLHSLHIFEENYQQNMVWNFLYLSLVKAHRYLGIEKNHEQRRCICRKISFYSLPRNYFIRFNISSKAMNDTIGYKWNTPSKSVFAMKPR